MQNQGAESTDTRYEDYIIDGVTKEAAIFRVRGFFCFQKSDPSKKSLDESHSTPVDDRHCTNMKSAVHINNDARVLRRGLQEGSNIWEEEKEVLFGGSILVFLAVCFPTYVWLLW